MPLIAECRNVIGNGDSEHNDGQTRQITQLKCQVIGVLVRGISLAAVFEDQHR